MTENPATEDLVTAEGLSLETTRADRGTRLDQFLKARLTQLSRARLQSLIEGGQVRVSGKPARSALRLKGGETIQVQIPALRPAVLQPEALDLSVLFQDQDVVVLNKAAGMVVHPGAGHHSGTLVNALLHHVADLKGVGGERRPGLVHRLDKDTSGVLVVAKHEAALTALQTAFATRAVEKVYVALTFGQPPDSGTFRSLYGRHPRQRLRFTGRAKAGKEAVTHFRTIARYPSAAQVEVCLETGRTHQIRVHFAEAGFPLLADALYGNRSSLKVAVIARQALHALRLTFPHPRHGRRLTFEAPVPVDFRRAIALLESVK